MDLLRKIINWIKLRRYISLAAVLILVGAGYYLRNQLIRRQGDVSAPLKKGTIVQSVYGIGTVTANQSFQIKPTISTTLDTVYRKEGDEVLKGDPLLKIDGTMYRAPFSGTITAIPNKKGENLVLNQPVLVLVNLDDRFVLVSLEQQGALRVQRGQKVKLSFDTIRETNFDGTVESIYPNNSNFLARIEVKNMPRRILPGMTADVAITIVQHENVILVPVAGLDEGKYVWVQQTLPKKVEVSIGIVDKDFAEIVSGDVHEGDQVLIHKKGSP